jgi:ABC-type branched-subunit amino acid transport system substrate-binding protein
MRPHLTLRSLLAILAIIVLVAAACGNSDDSASDDDGSGTDTNTSSTDDAGSADGAGGSDDADGAATGDDEGEEATAAPMVDPEPTIGFDGETISLGYLTDQSGGLKILGLPLAVGSQIYWDWVNTELGGIDGQYQVELVLGDTKDDSAVAVQEYQRLKGDVALFAQILSTPPTQAVLQFLKADGVIGVPGSLAGLWGGELNLLPAGAAYDYEMINIADWFVNQSGLGSIDTVACVVYIDDLYGQSTLKGLQYAAAELGFTLAEAQTVARLDTDFSATVAALEGAGCEVVYAITVPTEQNGLLAEALSQGFEPIWLGALPAYLNLFAASAPDRYANFYVTLDSPSLDDRSVSGMADFLDRFATYGDGEPNTFHLSGYLQQIAVHALLDLALSKGDLSRVGLLAAAAELGLVNFDGLAADYVYGEPENRVPASGSRIFKFDRTARPNFVVEVGQIDSELNAGYSPF